MPRSPASSFVVVLLFLFLSAACCCHVASAQTAPVIYTVSGCAVDMGNMTSGCVFNTTVLIKGSGLDLRGVVSVYVSNIPATNVIVYNSTAISAVLPYIGTAGGTFVFLYIRNATMMSNMPFYCGYASVQPIVYRVSGCATNNDIANSTAGCVANTTVVIEGERFVPPPLLLYASVAGYATPACTYLSTTRIQCVLPTLPDGYYNRYLSVVVQAGSYTSGWITSDIVALVLYGALPAAAPVIYSVQGCATNTFNTTAGCDIGSRIAVQGVNFGSYPRLFVGKAAFECINVTSVSSSQLSCQLPYIATSNAATYIIAVLAMPYYSQWVPYLSYRSQSIELRTVKGCADDSVSVDGTAGCTAGARISISGRFPGTAQFSVSLYTGAYVLSCLSVFVQSSGLLGCTLPSIDQQYTLTLMSVRVSNGMYSADQPLLSYASFGPWIDRVQGCAINTGNSTAGCNGGDWVQVLGGNLTSGNLQVYFKGYASLNRTFVNDRTVLAQLPYAQYSLPQGTPATVQVYCSGQYSNMPQLVSFSDQRPVITAIRGCAVNTANATSGCLASTLITVTGTSESEATHPCTRFDTSAAFSYVHRFFVPSVSVQTISRHQRAGSDQWPLPLPAGICALSEPVDVYAAGSAHRLPQPAAVAVRDRRQRTAELRRLPAVVPVHPAHHMGRARLSSDVGQLYAGLLVQCHSVYLGRPSAHRCGHRHRARNVRHHWCAGVQQLAGQCSAAVFPWERLDVHTSQQHHSVFQHSQLHLVREFKPGSVPRVGLCRQRLRKQSYVGVCCRTDRGNCRRTLPSPLRTPCSPTSPATAVQPAPSYPCRASHVSYPPSPAATTAATCLSACKPTTTCPPPRCLSCTVHRPRPPPPPPPPPRPRAAASSPAVAAAHCRTPSRPSPAARRSAARTPIARVCRAAGSIRVPSP